MSALVWEPTFWGRIFTGSPRRRITIDSGSMVVDAWPSAIKLATGERLEVELGVLWARVRITHNGTTIEVDGIPNRQAAALERAWGRAVERVHAEREESSRALAAFAERFPRVLDWFRRTHGEMRRRLGASRWLTHGCLTRWLSERPDEPLMLGFPLVQDYLASLGAEAQQAADWWRCDLTRVVAEANERLMASELTQCADFFQRVEKSPLTDEQARAVVCFDDRVLVVAAAGSGKTSTMVAKAGYAVHRGLVAPECILVLAFNKDAAKELGQRIRQRLEPLGLPAHRVEARTFHAFGLSVIGEATGRKPSLAPWLDHGGDTCRLLEIVDDLKDRDPTFRSQWDLFRVVLGRDLPSFGEEEEAPEDWDNGKTGFRTLGGDVVRSQGERLIADWLFYNGVSYEYEPDYKYATADAAHRQYKPDFYLRDIDTYLEHWALDSQGKAPPKFYGYAEDMRWKKQLHSEKGTTLIETTMAMLWSGQAFVHLTRELTQRGLVLDPNPDRPVPGRKVIQNEEMARTFRTFLVHAKSNRLSDADLHVRLQNEPHDRFRYRHLAFLTLFSAIRAEWERRLREEDVIDFEDMLGLAADHIEQGHWTSPFRLVMVDEFQDASQARARLSKALASHPDTHLFAVGDDWQSINRFAGADLSVMTRFEHWFGKAETLRLERTFRCPQALCDLSGGFVQRNPEQLRKHVKSDTPAVGPVLEAVVVPHEDRIRSAIRAKLDALNESVGTGAIPAGTSGQVEVLLLGRYKRDNAYFPDDLRSWGRLRVRVMTVHGSKGLEADYVLLPRMVNGYYAFPSTIEDDPVLSLVRPAGDDFEHAEERRLFYVALTRARRSVFLITEQHKVSPFIVEMQKKDGLVLVGLDGEPAAQADPCGQSGCNGTMVLRRGRYGPFWGCSNYPRCTHKKQIRRNAERQH
ncbi:UvrD-helicase domain-containing protein [Pseudomarimonas arenosa]|uniref:DNA 3'-5' helicase n=1 Tax=Pseudomarimonas arenosa TaxID=2774145 RepID=A0AAW3ZCS5_9GAMM|nr:UvrD-helicase domain-containing protein [Pseudomarimonas arenosa]MBD8524143.1 UvrD-helicase domain-containing protein [Pseudomarimonas arenosa]